MRRHGMVGAAVGIALVLLGTLAEPALATGDSQRIEVPRGGAARPERPPGGASTTAGRMHPKLDPVTIGLCNTGYSRVSVATFPTTKQGRVTLFCGDSSSGYVHIRSAWQGQWQKVLSAHHSRALWDDFMVSAARTALEHPASGYPRTVSGRSCYSAEVRLRSASGATLGILHPTVVVDSRREIVAAAPTGSAPNCSLR
jgi:hypothetical protein